MRRLRDMRTVPGSVEEMLVEAIKSCSPLETSPIIQRRVYAKVLDVALGRRRKVPRRPRVRQRIGLSLLVLAGVAAGSTIGLRWSERPRIVVSESPPRVNPEQPRGLPSALLRD
jgi:hypothetical protein